MAATEQQLHAFKEKLDKYDTATVAALMENRKQLDEVNAQIDLMLSQAYVMEGGRRVFKTEDGDQVFDETGQEISDEILDFEQISDSRPTWEEYSGSLDKRETLQKERQEILEFQEKIDAARDKVDGGDISEAELEELDADLMDMMPAAVREQIPEMETPAPAPDLTAAFKTPAALLAVAPANHPSIPALTQ